MHPARHSFAIVRTASIALLLLVFVALTACGTTAGTSGHGTAADAAAPVSAHAESSKMMR